MYSPNNIWVKTISTNVVVMGVSATMVDMLGDPYTCTLSPAGTNLVAEDDFGSIEGNKLSADLISPISGTIIQINNYLTIPVDQGGQITSDLTTDAYNIGWMLVVQLSKPSELNTLLSPQNYAKLALSE
jgi:glycine cleavage system H protein